MFSPAEPTTAPQHSPHGEQDSAVLETQEAQEEQSLTLGVEQQVTEAPQVEAGLAVDAMSAAPAEVTPMMAASPAMAPMEGNPVGEEEAGVAKEQEVQTQEFSSGDGSAPPADEAGAASTPPGGGVSGGGPGEENAATEVSALEDDVEGESADGPATEAEAPAGPVHTTPRCPEDDPEFQATVARKDSTVAEQQQHEEPIAAAGAAQASSVSPANERESMAEAGQVNEMEQEEPGVFDAASFKAMLMEAIAAILPKNNEEADDFADSGKVDEVKSKATSKVESEKESAAGNIEQKAKEAPDTNSVPVREVQPLAPQDAGPPPVNIEASKAMPPKRGDSEVNAPLDQNVAEMDQTMTDAQVTEEQLANSNEPAFTGALSSKNEAKQHAQEAPVQFRQQEQATLATSEANAQATGEAQLTAMHQDRAGAMGQVSAGQQQTASKDTSARQKVSDRINGLYEQTKTDVETILNNLDTSVKTMFDAASSKATKAFEKLVDKRMSAYKSKRYSGLIGKGRWIKDLFAGLPDEVNAFFTEGRNLYLDIMDGELTAISEHVATELTAAKDRIKKGKQDIQDYVVSLPKDLQQVGKEAADEINSKFDELTESVNSKGEELVDTIADMYKESLDKVDARIEEMKAANRGLIDMALGALMGVIKTILMIKDMLFNLLAAALEALGAIISDPIGFLSNLIEGVKQGIQNFFSNILSNVMTGLIEWLTGSLGDVGIQMPDNLFSLSGIFSLVTQMLGLTWDYFRDKAVKMLGEPVVSAMETGLELFQIIRKDGVQGLWDHIKEQFTDLKEMVMDAIRDMIVTKVIEAGIKWILGLLSPAGAFIKAAMLIIDIVKFFVERAAQIFELVNAFIEGIKALASGNVGAVAKAIEKALVKAIPILIGFLAALVGVTGLTSKVQKIIKKVRKRIDKAIRKIIKKAKRAFGKLMGKKKPKKGDAKKIKDDNKKGKPDELTAEDKKKHKKIGEKIKTSLKAKPKGKTKGFKELHKQKKKEGEELEDTYQRQLKKGINLDIIFQPVGKDEEDNDIDVKVRIAPNTYEDSYDLGEAVEEDNVIIKKIFFKPNGELAPKAKSLHQELKGISTGLLSSSDRARKLAVDKIRENSLHSWHELEGAIYVPLLPEHMDAMSELDDSLQEDVVQKEVVILGSMERGGALMADQMDTSGVASSVITRRFDVKWETRDSDEQLAELRQKLEELLDARGNQKTHIVITETFVGGGASKSVLNRVIKKILRSYENVTVKLIVLQQTAYTNEPKDPAEFYISEDRSKIIKRQKKRGDYVPGSTPITYLEELITAEKLVIVSKQVRMIMGEDAGGQAIMTRDKSSKPFIIFSGDKTNIQAYQLSPKEGFHTKDVFLSLVSGKLRGKIGNIH